MASPIFAAIEELRRGESHFERRIANADVGLSRARTCWSSSLIGTFATRPNLDPETRKPKNSSAVGAVCRDYSYRSAARGDNRIDPRNASRAYGHQTGRPTPANHSRGGLSLRR